MVIVKKMLGIVSSYVVVLYALSNLILSVFSVLCFINIIWYFYVRYFLSENEYLLKLMEKRRWLKKFINLYRKTTMGFIMFEIGLYIVSTLPYPYPVRRLGREGRLGRRGGKGRVQLYKLV